jgi:AcrR family transcriptional regulator
MSGRKLPPALLDKLTTAAARFAVSFDTARMDDIATASGIPRATLYYYFAGKDDILAFILQSMLDDLRVSVDTALNVGGDAPTRLRAVVRAQLAHLAANPAAAQLLLMNLGRAGRIGVIAAGVDGGFHVPVRNLLADGVAAGELDDIDIDMAATAIYGAVTIVGLQALVATGALDVDDVADRLLSLLWSGVAATQANGPRPRR